MGTWDMGIFDNDSAGDFAWVIAEHGLSAVEEALDKVLAVGGNLLEVSYAEEGLAAADALARLMGRPGPSDAYTKDIDDWAKQSKETVTDALVEKARRSISRILTEPSEIVDLWEEGTEEFEAWKRNVLEVLARLGPLAPSPSP